MGPSCQVEETFFQLNKEELSLRATMDLVGPSRQALHVQSSSDDSRMLTTPRRAHRGGGRRRGPRLERPGDGEDGAVESQMERSGKLDWFGCAAAQPRCRPRETGARTEVEEGARLLD